MRNPRKKLTTEDTEDTESAKDLGRPLPFVLGALTLAEDAEEIFAH